MPFHSVNGDVHCAGRLRSIASVRFFDVRVHPCEIGSAPVTPGRHDQGYGKVDLVVEGKIVISQDGRQAVVGAGDFSFRDSTRASRVVVPDDLRMIGVIVPLGMISLARHVLGELTATRMDGASGSGALLASFLTTLGSNLESVRPREEAGLSAAAGDLLTATLAHAAGHGVDADEVGARSALLMRIRCFVEAELPDPGLSPASIAAAHHISVRQLHRLFEGEDVTVAELVRARRLAGCARDLADPELHDLGIGAVAARWGIMDSAKFSRIFRAAYGLSPREYRLSRFGAHRQERVR
jgi:AraC-like DNA-binding protein